MNYDPHGKRRNLNWTDAISQLHAQETPRGYTGHEMLDDVGLVHMNGRVYDPDIGRYLSADPFIQEAANAQNLKRYSYVLNNPLSYTDPSGFFFGSIFKAFKSIFKGAVKAVKAIFRNKMLRTVAAIGFAAIPGINVAVAGFGAGLIASGGDLKAGILGAVTAGAFNFIGHSEAFGNFLSGFGEAAGFVKTLGHGVIGGVANEIGGGNFLSGFASAGFVQGFSQLGGFDALGVKLPGETGFTDAHYVYNAAVATVVGGTASVLGGGKFKNGAITGAFSRLFNDIRTVQKSRQVFNSNGSPVESAQVKYGDWVPLEQLGTAVDAALALNKIRAIYPFPVDELQFRLITKEQVLLYEAVEQDFSFIGDGLNADITPYGDARSLNPRQFEWKPTGAILEQYYEKRACFSGACGEASYAFPSL